MVGLSEGEASAGVAEVPEHVHTVRAVGRFGFGTFTSGTSPS
jgi:hypothetical protein